MSKIANGNVVYSGWLVKSPPENKFRLSGPWKIFRSVSEEGIQYVLSFDVYSYILKIRQFTGKLEAGLCQFVVS